MEAQLGNVESVEIWGHLYDLSALKSTGSLKSYKFMVVFFIFFNEKCFWYVLQVKKSQNWQMF